ncbi:hypothetical protein [Natrarchaeobius chitinivorans]|uniref:hypothetical protein n=1 Tax=Natrarchaeobius chitinivorans TaxID=1679083 RepID=UPI000F52DFB2|nr:hypothetical protein [Natrarchaeobius chitinivorans]
MPTRRKLVIGASVFVTASAGCLDGFEQNSGDDDESLDDLATPSTNHSEPTRENDDGEEEDENETDAAIFVGDRRPVGYSVSVSVELGDASAMSIEYNGEEVKAVNEDGNYDIADFDDDGVMDVDDVEFGDSFTVYAIYGDSYVEVDSAVAA